MILADMNTETISTIESFATVLTFILKLALKMDTLYMVDDVGSVFRAFLADLTNVETSNRILL